MNVRVTESAKRGPERRAGVVSTAQNKPTPRFRSERSYVSLSVNIMNRMRRRPQRLLILLRVSERAREQNGLRYKRQQQAENALDDLSLHTRLAPAPWPASAGRADRSQPGLRAAFASIHTHSWPAAAPYRPLLRTLAKPPGPAVSL